MGPKTVTILDLDELFFYLASFKKICGRYPLTKEGLKAVVSKPADVGPLDWSLLDVLH
jgi:hypothetical protein